MPCCLWLPVCYSLLRAVARGARPRGLRIANHRKASSVLCSVAYAGKILANRVACAHNFYSCYNQANAYGCFLGHLERWISAVFQTDFVEATRNPSARYPGTIRYAAPKRLSSRRRANGGCLAQPEPLVFTYYLLSHQQRAATWSSFRLSSRPLPLASASVDPGSRFEGRPDSPRS